MSKNRPKTRPPEGPRYACGHRLYALTPRVIAAFAKDQCAFCRGVTNHVRGQR